MSQAKVRNADLAEAINTTNGGTGATGTLTGIIKGNGSSAYTVAVAGTDYQGAITLTTTGTSGAATLTGTILNIPNYSTGGGGTVSTTGSPASGNLTKFSGTNSITNGDLSGDVTTSGALATTLATVNTNTGSFGSSTAIPNFTVNGKGLITAASTSVVIAPAGTLSGTTLNSTVVTSSLTSVGTLANLTVTNPISGSITGNAATVTTNANLTGAVTSSGNATSLGSFTSSQLATALTDETGSGAVVFATSPSLTTAALGSSTATTQAPGDNSTKLATTAYVANAVLGQDFKEACKYASTAALPSIVYANGSSGVGATLTGVALAAISLDSSSPSVNDRVLIKNQVSTFQNGIYTVTATGSGIAVFVLTRVADFNQSFEIDTGDTVFVTAGASQTATTWAYNGIDQPVMGTDAITFVQTAGQGSFAAGNGITITGTSIAIDTSVTVDKTTAQTLTNKTLTSPAMTAPVLGTPASGNLANCTFPTLNQNTTGQSGTVGTISGLVNGDGTTITRTGAGTSASPYILTAVTGGTGTVTSIGVTSNASYLTSAGGPVTSSGTITLNKTTGLTANQFVATPNGTTGTADLRAIVTADLPSNIQTGQLSVAINGAGSAITTGIVADLLVPYNCTITSWTLLADQSGSIVVDVWNQTYASYPPTVTQKITASAPPTISSATKGQSSTLTGWTTSLTAGSTLRFNVNSATTITRVILALTVTRT